MHSTNKLLIDLSNIDSMLSSLTENAELLGDPLAFIGSHIGTARCMAHVLAERFTSVDDASVAYALADQLALVEAVLDAHRRALREQAKRGAV